MISDATWGWRLRGGVGVRVSRPKEVWFAFGGERWLFSHVPQPAIWDESVAGWAAHYDNAHWKISVLEATQSLFDGRGMLYASESYEKVSAWLEGFRACHALIQKLLGSC